MIRAEIISNQSVQDDIQELLEIKIPGIEYTVIAGVNGKGKTSKKLGDTVWPEMNFILFAYVSEEDAKKIKNCIEAIKKSYKAEGISLFFTPCIEI